MSKILTIAAREFNAAVRTRGFLVGLLTMPIFMFGSVAVQAILAKQGDVSDKKIAVIDRTPGQSIALIFATAAAARNATQIYDPETKKQNAPKYFVEVVKPSDPTPEAMSKQRLELSDKVRSNQLVGFFEIGKDAINPPAGSVPPLNGLGESATPPPDDVAIRYQSGSTMSRDLPRWATAVINSAVQSKRMGAKGVSQKVVQDALKPVPSVTKALARIDANTGQITDGQTEARVVSFLVPMLLGVMMFMMILVGSTPLMQVVFEEKTMRIAEVLLGSVTPFQLMAGKLIGMVGVSLVSVLVYMGGAYWSAHHYGYTHYAPLSLIAWFLVFQSVGVVMYGSLFIAIGSACADVKDTQSMIMPVMLLLMIPLFALVSIIESPAGTMATVLGYVPFWTPLVMVTRLAIPPTVPLWQPLVGLGGMFLMTIACIYVGGRIFRVGLLMQGKAPTYLELAKWVLKS